MTFHFVDKCTTYIDRVYYVSEKIMKLGSNVARENLISLGTCFGSIILYDEVKMNWSVSGKFTKSRKFRLHITALDFLPPYAQHKVHNSVKETVLRHTR